MKYFLSALLVACAGSLHAQFLSKSSSHSPLPADSFKPHSPKFSYSGVPGERMRNTGRALTIVGTVLFIGGIAVVSSADDTYYSTTYSGNGSYEEGDPMGAIGVLMITGGAGMIVPGIIFWSKGSKKYKAALQESPEASLHLRGNGLAIRYRF